MKAGLLAKPRPSCCSGSRGPAASGAPARMPACRSRLPAATACGVLLAPAGQGGGAVGRGQPGTYIDMVTEAAVRGGPAPGPGPASGALAAQSGPNAASSGHSAPPSAGLNRMGTFPAATPGEGVMTDQLPPSPDGKFAPVGLTFDDVLLLPAHSTVLPGRGGHQHPDHAPLPAPRPAGLRVHGHRDRGADGDRHGPPGRRRRAAPQPVRRGAGAAGGHGQAVRGGHDHQPGDLRARRHDRGRGQPVRPLPDLRRARDRRRQRPGRHRHQPRHQVRDRPPAAGWPR